MMIFVAGTMTMRPEALAAFEADVAAMRDRVLGEDGCIHYSLLVENHAAGLINVHEQWESLDALKHHFTMPWIIDFFNKHSPQLTATTVQVYDVTGAQPLPSM